MTASPSPHAPRYPVVDVIRGSALVLMLAYHFCFDLDYYGALHLQMLSDPGWIAFRTLIVTLFLGTVGISLHLATARGLNRPRYLRRLGLLALAAGAVSLGSWFMFPRSWIFFGVLHFIALASVLGLAFTRLYWTNLLLGSGLILLGLFYAHPWFDHDAWQWLGLATRKPITEDYVPLLPWFGVVLAGLFVGKGLFEKGWLPGLAAWPARHPLARGLAFGGRHSLAIYLLHQPLLLALLYPLLGR